MHHLLRPVFHEGAVGPSLLSAPEVILVIVLNKRALCVDVPVTVRVDIGLRSPVLVIENNIGVSIYTLDADAEAISTSSITVGPGGAGRLSVAPLWSSHSVRLHQECRRKINPSPWITHLCNQRFRQAVLVRDETLHNSV